MIKHGENIVVSPLPVSTLAALERVDASAEWTIEWHAQAARTHPLARRVAFRRRVWRDDQTLGDRIHAASAARRLSTAQHAAALADLRDGVTP
jgi:hypothetical protein